MAGTPAMVEKEIYMQAIAYNTVRALMLEAALTHGVQVERLSFKGSVDAMLAWEGWMHQSGPGARKKLLCKMLLAIASNQVSRTLLWRGGGVVWKNTEKKKAGCICCIPPLA